MIARQWTGRVRAEDADEYARYVEETGIRALTGTPGNVAAHLLVRVDGDEAEVVVYSVWESMEAVRRFAGDEPDRAVYYPEDERYLTHAPEQVTHWRVARLETGPAAG
ncbi:MAG TPA: antibiotic biosynthesis monooxygenase [Longimicrobiales bacterium]|nr:antibiotic biosynthesis monooxygenase [Longimicrobiales bacterium]